MIAYLIIMILLLIAATVILVKSFLLEVAELRELREKNKDQGEIIERIASDQTQLIEHARLQAVKAFAKYLVDKAEDGTIDKSELPDLVVDFLKGAKG